MLQAEKLRFAGNGGNRPHNNTAVADTFIDFRTTVARRQYILYQVAAIALIAREFTPHTDKVDFRADGSQRLAYFIDSAVGI